MKRILQVANGIALIVTIIINYLSNTGIFNNNTMASVSARYQNYFTPAGYAFSIWALIYIGLLAFVIYQGRSLFTTVKQEDNTVRQIAWSFVLSCLANCCWILAWLYDYTGLSVVIMAVLLFCLLKIIVNTHMELDYVPLKKIAFVWWPFSLYAGWITVAIIANIAAYLTKISWSGWGLTAVSWAVIMIIVAGIINLIMTWQRNMREYALVGVWALIAIAVANYNHTSLIVYTAIIVAVILFISSGIHAYQNRKDFAERSPVRGE